MLAAGLPVHPVCALAASYHSEPNPVGEKVYSAHFPLLLLPVGILVCGLLVAWLFARMRAKARKLPAGDAESPHG